MDNFWTDELVSQYMRYHFNQFEDLKTSMEQFKSSKTRKEWEVMAFKGNVSKRIYRLRDDGKFGLDNTMTGFTLEQLLQDNYSIHSIRRLSDDTTWVIEEAVNVWEYGKRTIRGFEISGGQVLVKTDNGTFLLFALQKLPVPVLVTVDGVEIFEGDEFWEVRDFKVLDGGKADKYDKVLDKAGITFSTREAAEAFVFDNRLSLSLKDLRELLDKHFYKPHHTAFLEDARGLINKKNK